MWIRKASLRHPTYRRRPTGLGIGSLGLVIGLIVLHMHPGRIVWINIFGVPIKVWNEVTFRQIANHFGSILMEDGITVYGMHLTAGKICSLMSQLDMINSTFNIQVDNSVL